MVSECSFETLPELKLIIA